MALLAVCRPSQWSAPSRRHVELSSADRPVDLKRTTKEIEPPQHDTGEHMPALVARQPSDCAHREWRA